MERRCKCSRSVSVFVWDSCKFEETEAGQIGFPSPHFNSLRQRKDIHQAVGRGHLPPAHKCTDIAIKLTLCQLFSHTFDGLPALHLLPRGYKRSGKQMRIKWWAMSFSHAELNVSLHDKISVQGALLHQMWRNYSHTITSQTLNLNIKHNFCSRE